MTVLTLLLSLAFAESESTEITEPFTFTPSIVSIAEPVEENEPVENDNKANPLDPADLTKRDAYHLGFDAARYNSEQRAEVSKRTFIYALVEGSSHGYFVGATLGWGLLVSITPHIIVNNIVVFFPVKVQYDETVDPEQLSADLKKSYRRGYRQYFRLRKRAIIIPVETATYFGGMLVGLETVPEGAG